MTRALIAGMLGLALAASVAAQNPPAHGRLFRPQDLGQLEGPDRDVWQRPDQIMDELGIAEGSRVADVGAGSGWFTIRLAKRVGPNGLVIFEDIQRQMIDSISRRVEREGLQDRTRGLLGLATDPRLPSASLDAILMVDAYHELVDPVAILRNLRQSLKPSGLIGIVNFKKDGGGPGPDMQERVDPERVIRDAETAGLKLVKRPAFLPYQYMLVFAAKT
jgi:ubiquinone/menaquinone biosynthesis C-methylase UbiE